MRSTSTRSLGSVMPGVVVGIVVGALLFTKGIADFRYLLADLKEDPLYLRGPGPTIVLGVVASALLLFIGIVVPMILRALGRARDGGVASPTSRAFAALGWVLIVAGGWTGYGLGAAVSLAAGGPTDHPGTMRLAFGAPLGSSVEVAARCRTPPGKRGVVAIVTSEAAGLRVQLLDAVTGAPQPYPLPTRVSVYSSATLGPGRSTLAVPGMPERPPMYSISAANDAVFEGPPAGFLDVYLYNVTSADVGERAGRLVVSAARAQSYSGVVNDLIPDDPWPEAFTLTLSWTCDIERTLPRPSPVPTRPGIVTLPSVGQASLPSEGTTTPALVRLVTNGAWASVQIGGATVTAADPPRIDGVARAALDRGTLRIEQSAAGVDAGRVVAATFAVSLAGAAPDGYLPVVIDGSRSGPQSQVVAVTISNVIGQDPVPVFAFELPLQWLDGSPVQVDANLLIGPVRRAAAW